MIKKLLDSNHPQKSISYVSFCRLEMYKNSETCESHSQENTHHFRKQSQCFQVLQDVTGFGCDQQHVELFHGLVDIPHGIRFDEGVLFPSGHQLWKGSKKSLDPGFRHLHELPRDNHWKKLGTNVMSLPGFLSAIYLCLFSCKPRTQSEPGRMLVS